MDAVREAAEKLVKYLGPEEAVRAARKVAGLDRTRVREALQGVREALIEAEKLTSGYVFGFQNACRAVEILEKAVHKARCAVNSMVLEKRNEW